MEEHIEDKQKVKGLHWHLIFAALGGMGMAIIYGLKVNASVAIVAMVNHTALHQWEHDHEDHHHEGAQEDQGEICFDPNEVSHGESEDGPFLWTQPQQGLVLGSYFWGYFVTQIPGGRIAELFGGKKVFFGAVALNALAALLMPVCSYAGYEYLIVMRILQGLGAGVTFPAMNVLISHWAPADERSTMSTIIDGGTALGTVISIPTSGLLAGSLGWESVFYIHGGLCVIWCVLWLLFVTDEPNDHKYMSPEEKDFLDKHTHIAHYDKDHPHAKVPWKAIFTSKAVWAIIISHTLNNFGWYMFLVELPLFMGSGLGFNIKENAGLSCVPFLCNWVFSIIYSKWLDWMHHNDHMSTTTARKLSMAIASVIPGLCLVGVSLSGCDRTSVVTLMIVATTFAGAMFSGVFSNHVDIASNFAGDLMGISNMVATVPGFIVPAFVGALTHGEKGIAPWHVIFYTTAVLLFIEFVLYTLMASGEEQEWNKVDPHDAHEKVEMIEEEDENKKNYDA